MIDNHRVQGWTSRRTRDLQRVVHLATGVALLAYVYAGPPPSSGLAVAVRSFLLPVLVLSGIAMWQWPKLRRRLKRRGARS